jgi:hypothetical protein
MTAASSKKITQAFRLLVHAFFLYPGLVLRDRAESLL